MEKLIMIFLIDSERGDFTYEFSVIPMTTVRQVMRRLGLEGFNLLRVSGKPVPLRRGHLCRKPKTEHLNFSPCGTAIIQGMTTFRKTTDRVAAVR